jgi:2-octaprenyl-6-methoxyphenol hydroxylase
MLAGGRALWPVVTQQATRLAEGRVALIAEAAHVLPPIGAQGLNTSVNDIAALDRLLDRHAPGSPAMMDAYRAERGPDIAARVRAIDIFNRVTSAPDPVSQAVRRWGLAGLHDIAPLRQRLVRAGMGPG